jgi:hypothetical protein
MNTRRPNQDPTHRNDWQQSWISLQGQAQFLLGNLSGRVDGLERRVTVMEDRKPRWWHGLPWVQLLGMLVLTVLGLTGAISPSETKEYAQHILR